MLVVDEFVARQWRSSELDTERRGHGFEHDPDGAADVDGALPPFSRHQSAGIEGREWSVGSPDTVGYEPCRLLGEVVGELGALVALRDLGSQHREVLDRVGDLARGPTEESPGGDSEGLGPVGSASSPERRRVAGHRVPGGG